MSLGRITLSKSSVTPYDEAIGTGRALKRRAAGASAGSFTSWESAVGVVTRPS